MHGIQTVIECMKEVIYPNPNYMQTLERILSSETCVLILLFFCNRHVDVQGVTDRWLHGLPGLLVQLRHKSPGMTQLIVDILKRAVMRGALKPDDHFLTHLVMFFCKWPYVPWHEPRK